MVTEVQRSGLIEYGMYLHCVFGMMIALPKWMYPAHFWRSLESKLCKNKSIPWLSSWETKVFVAVVHLSGPILAEPAKACSFDCHTAPCNFRQQKVCAGGIIPFGCFTEVLKKVQSTNRRVNRKEQRSSWRRQQAEAMVQWSFAPKSWSHRTKESFLFSLRFFACGSVCRLRPPERDSELSLC